MSGKGKIRIACRGADEIRIQDLDEFQGELKSLSKENYEKLKKEILELGFIEPVSVWRSDDGTKILNGHQRVRTLLAMAKEGYEIPEKIPANLVVAESLAEAKRMVLAMASQYGRVESQGLYEFMGASDFSFDFVKSSFNFPEIDFDSFGVNYFQEPVPLPNTSDHSLKHDGEIVVIMRFKKEVWTKITGIIEQAKKVEGVEVSIA